MDTIEKFYNDISKEYTDFIERCVPKYKEMHSMLFTYLPEKYAPKSILELGCGTGNLTTLISKHFPSTKIFAVDISGKSIKECKQRLPQIGIQYIKADFRSLDFKENSFDLIISSISIHHLYNKEKEDFFRKLFHWQTPKGILTFCDQFKAETDYLYAKHIELC